MVNLLVRGAVGAALALGLATGLGACNTMEGFGKDMAAAGRALSNSAERTKNGGSPFSASGSASTETTNSTASNVPASGAPTTISPAAGGSNATSATAPVTPVTPVN